MKKNANDPERGAADALRERLREVDAEGGPLKAEIERLLEMDDDAPESVH